MAVVIQSDYCFVDVVCASNLGRSLEICNYFMAQSKIYETMRSPEYIIELGIIKIFFSHLFSEDNEGKYCLYLVSGLFSASKPGLIHCFWSPQSFATFAAESFCLLSFSAWFILQRGVCGYLFTKEI